MIENEQESRDVGPEQLFDDLDKIDVKENNGYNWYG